MASLIADQQIGPNDIVLFDTGVYASGTAVLTAADAGAIFAGSPAGSTLAYSGTRIELNDSSNNLFSDLIFAGAGGTGIHIRGDGADDAHGNVIEHNQFLGTDTGVRSDSQGSNSIRDNSFVGNGTYGVYIGAQADAIVRDNTFSGSGAYGIYIADDASGTVHRNDVSGRGTGIHTDSSLAVVYDNDVHDNVTGIAGSGTIGPASASASTPPNRVFSNTTGIRVTSGHRRDRPLQPGLQQFIRH